MTPPPFFVVGFQRSGTTLLRLMLDNHPDIAIPLDTVGLWSRYEDRLSEYHNLASTADRARLVSDLLAEERIQLWETPLSAERILSRVGAGTFPDIIRAFHECYAETRGKTLWGDKDPGNMLRIPQLVRWFPECRMLHIIRDGRDACLSQLEQSFGSDDLLDCACEWREQVWWVRQLGAIMGPARYFELRYEDLVAQPESWLRRICGFLGVPYAASMLQYHESVSKSVPDSKRHIWPKLDQPPRADNTERWKRKLSPAMRACFEKRAWDVLRSCDYETFPARPDNTGLQEFRYLARRALKSMKRRMSRT
ncbi:MAG: sulfotransferase [Gemmatimonadota bacterium]